jgi:hypothetical protein
LVGGLQRYGDVHVRVEIGGHVRERIAYADRLDVRRRGQADAQVAGHVRGENERLVGRQLERRFAVLVPDGFVDAVRVAGRRREEVYHQKVHPGA